MDEFQKQMYDVFAFETNSFLSQLETILLQAENEDGSIMEAVPEIFRIMHTIKSSSAMMGFPNMSKLAHALEDLFHYIRDNNAIQIDKKALTDIVFLGVDYIKSNMDPDTPEADVSSEMDKTANFLFAIKQGKNKPDSPAAADQMTDASKQETAPSTEDTEDTSPSISSNASTGATIIARFKPDCLMIGLRAFELSTKVQKLDKTALFIPEDDAPNAESILQSDGLTITLSDASVIQQAKTLLESSPFIASVISPSEQAPPKPPQETPKPSSQSPNQFQDRRRDPQRKRANYMSVDIEKVDALINLTGEMIIASMGVEHMQSLGDAAGLEKATANLQQLLLDVQETTLSLRMITLQDVFHQLQRAVRDAASKLNKSVKFVMSGEEISLDRQIVESLSAPLLHVLRNAVDHGIEPKETRLANGKPEAGVVSLQARVEGNQAIISVSDDGAGIDQTAILAKAFNQGLITEEQAANMSEDEINLLIYAPGFSTKKEVTELSGRGVGMDVLNDYIRKTNGRLKTLSKQGNGTTIELHIPLTLSVLETMIVDSNGMQMAIPVSNLRKVFTPEQSTIREVNGHDTILLDDICYPIIHINADSQQGKDYTSCTMLLCVGAAEPYVIAVDAVVDQRNVVVKPVPPLFKNMQGFYGCTILGDGSVCLILDIPTLLNRYIKE